MKALKELTELEYSHRYEGKSLPEYARYRKQFSDTTANKLTQAVITWLKLTGSHAERISTTGRMIDRRKVVRNCIGQVHQIGSAQWIPGGGQKGSADIHAVIAGRSVMIEVKIGRDKLSEAQKAYRDTITKAGAIYYVARDFKGFIEFYNKLITKS